MSEFIFKGRSSQEFGPVERLPIFGKSERVLTVTDIPNGVPVMSWSGVKAGKEQFALGLRNRSQTVIDELYYWLNGEGRLILSNAPDRYVNAYVSGMIVPEPLSPRLGKATITFVTEPYKYSISNPTEELTMTVKSDNPSLKECNISYEGTEKGAPAIKLFGSGKIELWMNHNKFEIENVYENVTVDLSTLRVKDKDGNVINSRTIGDPEPLMLNRGNNYFEVTNNVSKVELTKNTRWK